MVLQPLEVPPVPARVIVPEIDEAAPEAEGEPAPSSARPSPARPAEPSKPADKPEPPAPAPSGPLGRRRDRAFAYQGYLDRLRAGTVRGLHRHPRPGDERR